MSITANKKLLVCLYMKFDGDQNLIIKELLEKNLALSESDVNKFLKENNVKLKDFCCFWDKDYPNEPETVNGIPVLCFERKKVS